MIIEQTEEHLASSPIKSADDEMSPRDGTRYDQEGDFPSRSQPPSYLNHLASDVVTTLQPSSTLCGKHVRKRVKPRPILKPSVTSESHRAEHLLLCPSFRPYYREQLFLLSNNTFVI